MLAKGGATNKNYIVMSEETQNLNLMMEERIELLTAKGDWQGAERTAQTLIEKAKERVDSDPSEIGELGYALEIMGNIQRDHNDKARALETYQEIISLLDDVEGNHFLKGRVAANMANIYEGQEQFDDAKEYFKWAVSQLENSEVPAPLELSGVLNNLAFIYEGDQRYAEAEELFLKALKYSSEELGSNHASMADIWNNLGGLQYKAGKFSQAIEMHQSALDVRSEILGENHVDTAQSWGNLALVYAAQEDYPQAKDCFYKALDILEESEDSLLSDYATVNANFMHILRTNRENKEAEAIEKRVSKFMKTR